MLDNHWTCNSMSVPREMARRQTCLHHQDLTTWVADKETIPDHTSTQPIALRVWYKVESAWLYRDSAAS